jgi:hypothetical protein
LEEEGKVYKALVGKPEGKRTLGRARRRSEWILGRLAGGVCIGFDWLKREIGDELFWML